MRKMLFALALCACAPSAANQGRVVRTLPAPAGKADGIDDWQLVDYGDGSFGVVGSGFAGEVKLAFQRVGNATSITLAVPSAGEGQVVIDQNLQILSDTLPHDPGVLAALSEMSADFAAQAPPALARVVRAGNDCLADLNRSLGLPDGILLLPTTCGALKTVEHGTTIIALLGLLAVGLLPEAIPAIAFWALLGAADVDALVAYSTVLIEHANDCQHLPPDAEISWCS